MNEKSREATQHFLLQTKQNAPYQIDNIQTLRALRNYIAERYGQAHGLENLDALSFEKQEQRIKDVYSGHLSNFAKFLNKEANVIAGKTSVIDRSVEGLIGRRALQTLNTINSQVGKNLVGYNLTSPFTNFLSVFQAGARINKLDLIKGFAQTVADRYNRVFGKSDGFVENNPTLISRKGEEMFSQKPMDKVGNFGYKLMGATDDLASEIIVRSKYNELTRTVKIGDKIVKQGMDPDTANIRAGEWASRLMGDRAVGQVPLVFNSKTLGLFTKFQLEVRNSLDASFYDVIQEADSSM